MDITDNNMTNSTSKGFFLTALKFGLLGGLLSVFIKMTVYFSNLEQSFFLLLLGSLVFFGTLFLGMRVHRDQNLGGRIKFGQAVKIGTLITVIMGVLGSFWNIALDQLDPSIRDAIITQAISIYEEWGYKEETIDQMISMQELMRKPVPLIFSELVGQTIRGLFFSAILGFFVTREKAR